MSRFVLVHGAWHGAWCWYRLSALLRAGGHEVLTPDLPGHGADRSPAASVTFNDYVQRVVDTLDQPGEPVVLVGHSMGGMVISQAAEVRPDRIRHLVYLAAYLPAHGQKLIDLARGDPDDRMGARMVFSADRRLITVRPETVREAFYADCADEDYALAQSLLVPQPAAPLATPVALTDSHFGRVPRSYLECTQDMAVSLRAQRAMPQRAGCRQVWTMDTGHSPFLSAPLRVRDHLLSV